MNNKTIKKKSTRPVRYGFLALTHNVETEAGEVKKHPQSQPPYKAEV
jgi:hypothetical protein